MEKESEHPTYRQQRTLGGPTNGDKVTFNHDRLLLDIACWLDVCDQTLYSHYMRVIWELKKEMQDAARPTKAL